MSKEDKIKILVEKGVLTYPDAEKKFNLNVTRDCYIGTVSRILEAMTEHAHQAIEEAAEVAAENGNHSTASDILKLKEKY